jgi:outer membrane biosynthesis protein TonB
MAEARARRARREELTVAFEAFRAQSEAPARTGRKALWYALSIAFHGALLAVGIAYSFWHIEELSPPMLKLTFMSAAPPPPAAALAAGGGAAAKKKVPIKPKAVLLPKPELVQPRDTPKQEPPKEQPTPEDHGDKSGGKGNAIEGAPNGAANGTPHGTGNTPGGAGTAPVPKFLAPNIGQGLFLSGDKGIMPIPLRKPGAVYRVLVKLCVSTTGNVDKLTIMKASDPLADAEALRVLKTFKYRPFLVNGTPAPFCYPYMVEFKTE